MRIRINTFLLMLIVHSAAFSQVKFEKVFGGNAYDYGYSVKQTYDRGYIVAGATTSFGSGNTDAYLLKTDSMGVGKWHKTIGGINIEQLYSIQQTADTGLVATGYTNSYGHGGYDVFLIRTDKFGDTMWTRTYGTVNWDFGYSVAIDTSDNGYIIAGGSYGFGNGNEDFYVVKTNQNGDTLWTRTYGGVADEEAKSIKQTSDGGFIITGNTTSFGDTGGGIYTVKINSLGDTVWTNTYNGFKEDFGSDVIEDISGGFIAVGKTRLQSSNNYNGIRISYSTSGVLNGVDTSYGGTSDNDGIVAIQQSPNGRLAVAGNTYSYGFGSGTSDFLLHIFNPYNGFHGPTFGGNKDELACSMSNTADGGYIICGSSKSYTTFDHIYLVKTDSNGVSSGTVNVILTGISEESKTQLATIFPVPANDRIVVDMTFCKNKTAEVSILNLLGQVVHNERITNPGSSEEFDASLFSDGIYFLNISGKDFFTSEKFIVQH